jgi:hypothetical protein
MAYNGSLRFKNSDMVYELTDSELPLSFKANLCLILGWAAFANLSHFNASWLETQWRRNSAKAVNKKGPAQADP